MISLIWAMDNSWLIGKDNLLPWHYREDLVYFKEMTAGRVVLMGDLTYQSLKGYYKNKPLPFKKIYVANLNDFNYPDAILVKDVDSFLKSYQDDIFVIGGKMIYQLALKYADYLYITHILGYHDGNVYFPKFDLNDYRVVSKRLTDQLIFTVYKKKGDF